MDYYELACARNTSSIDPSRRLEGEIPLRSSPHMASIMDSAAITTSPAVDCQHWHSVTNRILRQDYRKIHHLNVMAVAECQRLCITHTSMGECRSLSYSSSRNECLLSDVGTDQQSIDVLTQPNAQSEFYHCSTFIRNITTTTTTTTITTNATATTTTTNSNNIVALFDSPPLGDNDSIDNHQHHLHHQKHHRGESPHTTAVENKSTLPNAIDQFAATQKKQIPHVAGVDANTVRPVPPDSVQVDAECLRDGVNISIRIRNAVW
jgi:hypothetical protein